VPPHRPKIRDTKEFRHFLIKEASARAIGLYPFPVEHKLRNCSLSYVRKEFSGSPWRGLNVDFFIGDLMVFEKSLGFSTIAAPRSRVELQIHLVIILS
jgi:hypothetical protein